MLVCSVCDRCRDEQEPEEDKQKVMQPAKEKSFGLLTMADGFGTGKQLQHQKRAGKEGKEGRDVAAAHLGVLGVVVQLVVDGDGM